MSTSPYTLISQDASHILRLVQQPYATTLQHYSDRGCDQISLDEAALAALLRALPRAVVLAALDVHDDCLACGTGRFCARCGLPVSAHRHEASGRLHCPPPSPPPENAP